MNKKVGEEQLNEVKNSLAFKQSRINKRRRKEMRNKRNRWKISDVNYSNYKTKDKSDGKCLRKEKVKKE